MKKDIVKKEVSYGIIPIFVNKNGKEEFLLIQNYSDAWLFPKGHEEKNENFLETAERELFEETALVCNKVYDKKTFSENHIFYRDGIKIYKTSHYCIGVVKDKKVFIQEDEVKDFYWGSRENVLKKINFKNIKNLFIKSLNYLDFNNPEFFLKNSYKKVK